MAAPLPFRRALSIVALVCALAGASAGVAQNQVTNPDFDVDDANWFHDTSQNQQWSSEDADLCATSGSLTALTEETSPGFQYFSTRPIDCVPVSPDETVHLAIRVRASVGGTIARIYATYCQEAACIHCGTSSPFVDFDNPVANTWTTLEGDLAIPSTGVGAIYLKVDDFAALPSPFTVDLDRAYLGADLLLFQDDFERGEPCRWSNQVP